MTPKSIRSFAAGIIVAASVCGVVYFSSPNEVTSTKKAEKPSAEKMKSELASDGYVIHTEEEWQKQIDAAEAAKSKETEEKAQKEEPKQKIVYRTMLTVTSGMTSIDVGRALEKAKIIKSAKGFFDEVEKRGVSSDLRPGTYEIDSEMKVDEVISAIFK